MKTKKVKAIELNTGDYVLINSNFDNGITDNHNIIGRVKVRRTLFHNHKRIIVYRFAWMNYPDCGGGYLLKCRTEVDVNCYIQKIVDDFIKINK